MKEGQRLYSIKEYLFNLDARRTWITKRPNQCVARRETRILQIDRTGTLQYKWTERVRYKTRMVASVKRGVRRRERAGAQRQHGCRKLSAETENTQPPGSCRVPRGGSGAIDCRKRSTEAENALPLGLVEGSSCSGKQARDLRLS